MIVLVITWTGTTPFVLTEAFGPWVVEEDGSHLRAIGVFIDEWHTAMPEARMVSSCMYIVTSPEDFRPR